MSTYEEAVAQQIAKRTGIPVHKVQHLSSDYASRMVFGAPVAMDTFMQFMPDLQWHPVARRMADGTLNGPIFSARMVLVPHETLKTPVACNDD